MTLIDSVKSVGRSALPVAVMLACIMLLIDADVRERSDGRPPEPAQRFMLVFDQIWTLVREHFYDPDLNGVDWDAARERYRPRAIGANDDDAFAAVINDMLAELRTSHTHYYHAGTPAYFQIIDVFDRDGPLARFIQRTFGEAVRYPGIGISTREIKGKTFITNVFEGAPADEAGLLVGDEIPAVDGAPFHPVNSFRDRVGEAIVMTVQRAPVPAESVDVTVTPEMLQPTEMFLRAMEQSARIIERGGARVAYIHVWSYAGLHYQRKLKEIVCYGPLKDADALVLDIRDGWGGANPAYLNLFNRDVPVMTMQPRNGEPRMVDGQWRKPVVLLINEGSRSGKEIIAYGFRRYDIGPIVGTRTKGAVVAGRPFVLADDSLLYLAVSDVRVDGERLEGVGVAPDIEVPFDVRYAAGADPQLDRAVEEAARLVRKGG
jgi:carboxyl-terminal processing protease